MIPAKIIVIPAAIGSTTPDATPYQKAFFVLPPSLFSGSDIIAPSGKF